MGEGVAHIYRGEEHTSGRHERVGEERREERKGDMITKETARKKFPAGEKRQRECGADKEEKEHGGRKGVGGQREGERETQRDTEREREKEREREREREREGTDRERRG